MTLAFREIPSESAPIDLLLLADPSEAKLRTYLAHSRCFVASEGGETVAACAILPIGADRYELMSIAVHPAHQKSGYGTALLQWIIDFFRAAGARDMVVGTGSFGYQLAFYQRQGFRVTGIDRDFFIKHYPAPIVEDGIPLRDMLRLTLTYPHPAASEDGTNPPIQSTNTRRTRNIELAHQVLNWNSRQLRHDTVLTEADVRECFAERFVVEPNGRHYAANPSNYLEFLNGMRASMTGIAYQVMHTVADEGGVVFDLSVEIAHTDGRRERFLAMLLMQFDERGKVVLWKETYLPEPKAHAP